MGIRLPDPLEYPDEAACPQVTPRLTQYSAEFFALLSGVCSSDGAGFHNSHPLDRNSAAGPASMLGFRRAA